MLHTYISKTMRQIHHRLKDYGTCRPIEQNSDENFRCSARILRTKAKATNLIQTLIIVMKGMETTVSTKTKSHRLSDIKSTIQCHMCETKHKVDWENWPIISKDRNLHRLFVGESLAITELQLDLMQQYALFRSQYGQKDVIESEKRIRRDNDLNLSRLTCYYFHIP